MAQARLQVARGDHDSAWASDNRALQGIEGLIRHFRSLFDQQLFVLDKLDYYFQAFAIGWAKGGRQGLLRAVPLHALRIHESERLIQRCPVQYLPTLALLPLRRPVERSSGILLIGCAQDGFASQPLDAVPSEIEALTRIWSDKRTGEVTALLIPPDGSPAEAGVPLSKWRGLKYLHVACHGVFSEARPLDSALRLGKDAVRTSEFFTVQLQAELVILSACDVGSHAQRHAGSHLVGDEWVGLYLPLFYAGAQAMLVSLWGANSEKAVQYMTTLHNALSEGAAPAQAFQHAGRAMSRKKDPLWANWYLVGFPSQPASDEKE